MRKATESRQRSWGARFHTWFNDRFERMLGSLRQVGSQKTLDRPKEVVWGFLGIFVLSFLAFSTRRPFVLSPHRCRTIRHQPKAPTGTRLEVTEDYVKQVEDIVRQVVRPGDLNSVVSNIGVMSDLSALTTPNSAMHTAFVQVGLKEDHKISSFVYMERSSKSNLRHELPQLRTYFQSGGLVDSVLNQGMPAPIDVQVSGMDLQAANDNRARFGRQDSRPFPAFRMSTSRKTWITRRSN